MLTLFLFSLLLGIFAGLLAGLFGLGGGIMIVPVLAELFRLQSFPDKSIMIIAVATSLATIIPTSISAIWRHHQLHIINWYYTWKFIPGILIGATLGAFVATFVSNNQLRTVFILYLIYVGLNMLLSPGFMISDHLSHTHKRQNFLVGIVIGCLSSVLGIGGGTLTVPYLVSQRLAMREAIAIASVCGLPIAVSGTLTYAILGWRNGIELTYNLGYVYLPAWFAIVLCSTVTARIGAEWANKIPGQKLKYAFSLVVFLIALKMMRV